MPAEAYAQLAIAVAELADAEGEVEFMLDFDGTIAPIVSVPSQARAHPSMMVVLRRIAARSRLSIVSGRPAPFLAEQLAFLRTEERADEVDLYGQYGLMQSDLFGNEKGRVELDRDEVEMLEDVRARWLETPIDGVLFEDKGSSLGFHYRNAEDKREPLLDWIDSVLPSRGLLALTGKMVYEIAPESAPSKRSVAMRVATAGTAAIFAGDDYGDLEVFKVMHDQRAQGEKRVAILVQGGFETPPELLSLSDIQARDQDELAFVLDQILRAVSPL